MNTSRNVLTSGLESQERAERLARIALRWIIRWRCPPRDPRLSVLIFHRVRLERDRLFPTECYAACFERTLSLVRSCFRVIPLSEAVSALRAGKLPLGALAVTFDDGYADNVTVALPILRRLGLPATFFIAPGYLDGCRMFNDTIIEAVRAHEGEVLDLSRLGLGIHATASWDDKRVAIHALIGKVKHLEFREREEKTVAIADQVGQPLPADLMLTSSQLKQLAANGMEIGGHTLSHPILVRTSAREAEREIAEGRARLEGIVSEKIRLFAYPNGEPVRDYDASHVALVKRLGFEAAFSTAWGVARTGSDLYQLPRFTPWDAEPWKFCMRLAHNLGRVHYQQV